MLIQQVTGQSPITEIRHRISVPFGLHGTSFPLTSKQIPAPYAHGYYGTLDATNLVNPSCAWTAGAMISTVDDLASTASSYPAAPRGGTTADTPAGSRPSRTPARTATARPSSSTTIT
jgi:CubicO group peptidase (beta-lactamase class C family)